jgi:radical SAM superfamily enzyme YgiQ (UPF0313 family)
MKVLLIQPPVEDFYDTSIRTFPLGLASLAASLESEGVCVEILDCHSVDKTCQIPIPSAFRFMEPYYCQANVSPFKLFTRYFHFGLMWDEIEAEIKARTPDIVGISANFTPYFDQALRVAQIVKGVNPHCVTVLGGSHVSSVPEKVLVHREVDYIILGEGEERFRRLVKALKRGNEPEGDGIAFRRNNELIIRRAQEAIADLDKLPHSAIKLLDPDKYLIEKSRYAMLLSSRGCPQACTFCSVHLVMGTTYRTRSVDNIMAEMKMLYETYGIRVFDFEDDNFTLERERLLELLHKIIAAFPPESVTLTAMNGLSLKNLDGEVLGLLKKAGLRSLNIATVSAREMVIETFRRPHTYAEFRKIIALAFSEKLMITAYIILGLPGDTVENMLSSIIALAEEPVLIGPSIFYPTPGTKIYQALEEKGLVSDDLYATYRSSCAPIETDEFTRTDLISLMRLVRLVNYMKRLCDNAESDERLSTLIPAALLARTDSLLVSGITQRDALTQDEIAIILLALFWQKGRLYGVERKKERRTFQYVYTFYEEKETSSINTEFLKKLYGKSIKGPKKGTQLCIDIDID